MMDETDNHGSTKRKREDGDTTPTRSIRLRTAAGILTFLGGSLSRFEPSADFDGTLDLSDYPIKTIEGCVFSHCHPLGRIILPASVVKLDTLCFNYGEAYLPESHPEYSCCRPLTEVVLPGKEISVGYMAFFHCKGVVLRLPSVQSLSIDPSAFKGCGDAFTLVVPDQLTRDRLVTSLPENLHPHLKTQAQHQEVLRDEMRVDEVTPAQQLAQQRQAFLDDPCQEVMVAGNKPDDDKQKVALIRGILADTTGLGKGPLLTVIPEDPPVHMGTTDNHAPASAPLGGCVCVEENDHGFFIVGFTQLPPGRPTPTDLNLTNHHLVPVIAKNAFKGSQLQTVTLEGQEQVESGAFEDCAQLAEVNNSHELEIVNGRAFAGCGNLKFINLSGGVCIDAEAFANAGLEEVILSARLIILDKTAFLGCKNLEKVTILVGGSTKDLKAAAEIKDELLNMSGLDQLRRENIVTQQQAVSASIADGGIFGIPYANRHNPEGNANHRLPEDPLLTRFGIQEENVSVTADTAPAPAPG